MCDCPRAAKVLVTATAVGLLTGFLGVGGGFLVVPALVLALALPMTYAVGTSLVVITLTSAAALAVRAGVGTAPDWGLVAALTAASAAGGIAGARLADRIDTVQALRSVHRPGARHRRLHRHPGSARTRLILESATNNTLSARTHHAMTSTATRRPRQYVGFGHSAGPDEGAELVVGEGFDQRWLDAGRFDAAERIGTHLAAGCEPVREAAHGELPDAGGPGCGVGVEQPGDPGVQGGPAHRQVVALAHQRR